MPTDVATARIIITGDNSQAIQAIQQARAAALKQLDNLKVSPVFTGMQAALKEQIKQAQAALQVQIGVTIKPIAQAQLDAALGKIKQEKTVKIGVELNVQGDVAQKVHEIKAKLAELRSGTQDFLKLDVSSVEKVIQLLRQQIAELTRLESQIPSSRPNPSLPGQGGGGGGPPNALVALRNELKAGQTDIAGFDAGLKRLQTTLQGDLSNMQALGTTTQDDARKLGQLTAALAGVNAEINKNSITNLRSDLAGARTAFEQAIGAAGRFNFTGQRQATQAYEAELNNLVARIRAVGQQAGVTQTEMRALNGLSQQLASQKNALNGVFSQVGLAGNVTNALKSLPQFASQLGGSLGAAFSGAQQLTGGLEAMAGAAGPVGVAIGVVVTAVAALVAGLGSAINTAGQFQQTMVDLKALNKELPTQEFAALNETAKSIGVSMGVGPREAASALLELNKAGLSTSDILSGGAKAALDLAGAAGITADKAAVLATAAQTAFGIAGKDMPGIADVFANFANKTFLGAEDLQQAMASVGPVAKNAGLSIQQFAGYMATLAQGGFKQMSDAGSSMKSMLLSLQAPSTTAAGAIEKLKLQVYDASGKMRPLGDILNDLRAKLAGKTEDERNNFLKTLFGTYGIQAATILMGDFSKSLDENRQHIEDNINAMGLQGEAARVARERNESFQGQLRILKATWEQLTITLGEKFLPALTDVLKGVNNFLREVKDGGPTFEQAKITLGIIAATLLTIYRNALAIAAGNLWTKIATGIAGLSSGGGIISGIGTALGGLPGIIALVIAAAAIMAAKVISDLRRTYAAIAEADDQMHQSSMDKVNSLLAKHTELGRAQAKMILLTEQLQQAQQGDYKGTNIITGETIYGPVDEARVKKLQGDLAATKDRIGVLSDEEKRRAAAEKTNQSGIQSGLKLTDDQLKKQASTIKELRDALAKPLEVFGGTEFQNQLTQIGEKYRELREKLYANVRDPKLLAPLKAQLAQRQSQETANARTEYGSKASDAAAEAERAAQNARVSAMAEGSAKIRAQARLDTDDVRRQVAEQVKAWRDFPDQVARIRKAGASQIAQIESEANRQIAEADKKAADERLREAKRQQAQINQIANLGRQFQNTNANFGLQLSEGKATPESLQRYQQAVAGLRAEIEKLPPGQQNRFSALLGQAAQFDQQGQALVKLKDTISEVAGRVKDMTVAELEAARARWAGVPAAQALLKAIDSELPRQRATEYKASVTSLTGAIGEMSDAELASRLASEKATDTQGKRVKAIEGEIEARKKLRDATLLQGRLELQKNDAQAVVDNYEARKTAAQGNAEELLRIEQESGAEVLAARQRLAQVDAETAVVQAREKFGKLLDDARKHGQDTTSLESQQATAIQQIRDHRDAVQLQNKVASDKALTDQTKATTDELVKLELDRQERLRGIDDQHDQRTISRYDLNNAQATSGGVENLSERLANERTMGQQVVLARQDMAKRASDAEVNQMAETYRQLKARKGISDDEIRQLDTDFAQWKIDHEEQLNTETERIYFEGAQARIAAEKAVADAILGMQRDLVDGLNQRNQSEAQRRQQQADSDLQQELRSVGDNEEAKLAVYQRTEAAREQLALAGINARMASDREAENRRWDDLQKSSQWTAADQKLRERLAQEHQNRLTEIATQGEFDKGQAVLQIQNQTQDQAAKVQEKRAQDIIKPLTRNLNDMTVAQRQTSEATLRGWLTTFQNMGVAGQAAAKVIQDALDNVATANADAQQRAVDLAGKLFPKGDDGRYANTQAVSGTLADRTNKIGKPDTQSDAEAKGREAYASEIAALKQGIADANKVIEELGKVPAGKLNAEQALALQIAQQYLPIFTAQLGQTQKIAADAGTKAGKAFVDGLTADLSKAQDAAADAALQLAEANHKLANSQGLAGTQQYVAALQAYRDYWAARMVVLRQSLADAQQAETAARATLAAATTDQARQDAQAKLSTAITATATAQGQLNTATTNYTNGQQAVLNVDEQRIEGEKALAQAKQQLNGILGQQAPLYQSEIDSLINLRKQYPALSNEINEVIGRYQDLQKARKGVVSKDSIKLDFQIGVQQGQQKLGDAISQMVQGIGQLATPAGLAAVALDKLNVVGTILEGIFSAIEEPIQMLQEPLKLIGEMLGSLIAANLRMLAPILTAIVKVLAFFYDAVANLVYTVSFHRIDIRRKENDKKKDPAAEKQEQADLQKQQLDNESGRLDLDYQKGLISKADYEAKKLALTKKRIDAERQAELDALKEKHKDDGDPALKKEVEKGEAALRNLGKFGLKDSDVYKKISAALEQARAKYMSSIQGSKEEIDAINQKYSQEYEKAQLGSLEDIHKAELEEVDDRVRRGLLTERQGAEEKYRLTVEYLERQRTDAITAAAGDQQKILEINRKYDGLILDAKLEMLQVVAAAYRQIGETLMDSITSSIKDGLLNALKQGNFGAFRQQFRQNMRQAMFDAVLSAAIETAAMKGILQPAIDALTAAFQTDDKADDNAAIQGLLTAGSKVEAKMRQIYTAMKPLRDAWGITGDQNSEQTMTVTGQIDKPEVKISLDALGMLAGVINTNIPGFTTALTADAAALGLHTPVLAANTAALPGFVSAVDQFGIHEAAHQQNVTSFGGFVGQFGGFVHEFGGHVQRFGTQANAYNPQAKR